VAGASELELPTFVAWAWSGAFCWVCTFVLLGWALGEQWERVFTVVEQNIRLASLIVCALVAVGLVYRYWWQPRRRRRSTD